MVNSPDLLCFAANTQTRLVTLQRNPITGKEVTLNHTSLFLREPRLFGLLVKTLHRNFPKGVPIEIYAGSHGEDALSAALCLHAAFGSKAANYPVIVSDLCPDNFERSRQGIVSAIPSLFTGKIMRSSWRNLEKSWRSAQRQSGKLLQVPLERFLEKTPLPAKEHGHFLLRNDENLARKINFIGPGWNAGFQQEKLFRFKSEAQTALSNLIHFEPKPVDVVAALSQKPKDPVRPRVVMLRNMVYLLPRLQQGQLLKALQENLPPGSLLGIGLSEYCNYEPDAWNANLEGYEGKAFLKALRKAGFKKVEFGNPYLWRKTSPKECHAKGWTRIFQKGFWL